MNIKLQYDEECRRHQKRMREGFNQKAAILSYLINRGDTSATEDDEFITDMGPYRGFKAMVNDYSKPVQYAPATAQASQNDEAIKHLRVLVQTGRFAKEAKWFSGQASAEFKAAKEFLESLK